MNRNKFHRRPHRSRHILSRLLVGTLAVVVLLGITNVILLVVYHNRTYPRTTMGKLNVGNDSYAAVKATAERQHVISSTLTLGYGNARVTISLADLGATSDISRTVSSVSTSRSWWPLFAIFKKHVVAYPITLDTAKVAAFAAKISSTFHKPAVGAKAVLANGHFTAADAVNGYDLDQTKLLAAILQAVDRGQSTVTAPIIVRGASGTKAAADVVAQNFEHSLSTPITYSYNGATHKVSPADIASWYKPAGNGYELDDFAIRTYIESAGVQMGVHPRNLTTLVTRTKQAIASNNPLSVDLEPFATSKIYNYCVQSRGVDASQLDGLKAKLVSTYNDLRGWSLDGQVQFKYVTTGCDFTVWLASPSQMGSFGAICDDYWDCEVNNNVVVNVDRWQTTTPAWQSYGGSVEDYRVMLINHETGHMLGFHHWQCPGSGQPAPVMMQESIALNGCTFNIWPTQPELDTLRRTLGF